MILLPLKLFWRSWIVMGSRANRNPSSHNLLAESSPTLYRRQHLSEDEKLEATIYRRLACRCDRRSYKSGTAGRDQKPLYQFATALFESIISSVVFPAFALGLDPTRRILCVSYSGELAFERLPGDDLDPWYMACFPETRVVQFTNSETEIELTRRGFRLATSIGGNVRVPFLL